ncbi:sensor histidine kinase [Thalassolituus sp.]|uniref:sensor histidine kinase n=1 Tax=Thalassolituus sp. TaxID=2030822 RepID=UPI003514D2AC
MDPVSLPLRIPYILRAGIIISLGIGAWAIAALMVLDACPPEQRPWALGLVAMTAFSFCSLAFLGTRELLVNSLAWRVDDRDWRFWLFLSLSHACSILLVGVAEVPASHAPYMLLMVVNSASLAVRFNPRYALSFNTLVAVLFALQFEESQWLILALCIVMQLVLWSFGLSIVVEVSEVRRLRVMGDELRMAQAQIAESERMLERRNIRHNLHDNMGHELATLHMNLQIVEQQAARLELDEDVMAPLARSRSSSRRMFAVLDDIVTGLRQVPSAHFYDALTDLIEQATTLSVIVRWDDKVRISEPKCCEALLSVVREFLTNVMKHSEGRDVLIRSQYGNGRITLELTDLAVFEGDVDHGNGLSGVAERISAMSGEFDVSKTAEGRLCWTIVLPEDVA